MSGQFAVFTYMGPLLSRLTQVGSDAVGLVFAIYGVCGFIGIVVVSNIVDSWGALKTSVLSVSHWYWPGSPDGRCPRASIR